MGIGPALAIPAALKKAGITIQDVDLFEVGPASLLFFLHLPDAII